MHYRALKTSFTVLTLLATLSALVACGKSGGKGDPADPGLAGTYIRTFAYEEFRKDGDFCLQVRNHPNLHGVDPLDGNHPDVLEIGKTGTVTRLNTDPADTDRKTAIGALDGSGNFVLAAAYRPRNSNESAEDSRSNHLEDGNFSRPGDDKKTLVYYNTVRMLAKSYTLVDRPTAENYLNAVMRCSNEGGHPIGVQTRPPARHYIAPDVN